MHAGAILQKCLGPAYAGMHALRRRALLQAVAALIAGRRLTLIDLARAWPGAERVRAPLKALDRLLGNRHLHAERERLYGGMVRWLIRTPSPVIVVDWCRLKADGRWHLLRAAVPVGGRTLTLFEQVFPEQQLASPKVERAFLHRLKTLLPADSRPVLVTDAGFRAPWCRSVEALGWHWLTRLRHRTHVKPTDIPDEPEQWVPCRALYGLVRPSYARDLGMFDLVRSQPIQARLVLHARAPAGRRHTTLDGRRRRNKASRQCAKREAEPWLLALSPSLQTMPVPQVVAVYRRRMQIEASFRDLKSHRYGQGFEDSLTRKRCRLEVLLLVNALAAFASWLAGMACEATGIDQWLYPATHRRKLYSTLRVGREALIRPWPMGPVWRWVERLRTLPPATLDQMIVTA